MFSIYVLVHVLREYGITRRYLDLRQLTSTKTFDVVSLTLSRNNFFTSSGSGCEGDKIERFS